MRELEKYFDKDMAMNLLKRREDRITVWSCFNYILIVSNFKLQSDMTAQIQSMNKDGLMSLLRKKGSNTPSSRRTSLADIPESTPSKPATEVQSAKKAKHLAEKEQQRALKAQEAAEKLAQKAQELAEKQAIRDQKLQEQADIKEKKAKEQEELRKAREEKQKELSEAKRVREEKAKLVADAKEVKRVEKELKEEAERLKVWNSCDIYLSC